MMRKITDTFKELDTFGEGINLKIKGHDTFGTCIGAILTMIIYAVVIVYTQMKFTRLKDRLDT